MTMATGIKKAREYVKQSLGRIQVKDGDSKQGKQWENEIGRYRDSEGLVGMKV